MPQSLDVISVNLWNILISLANLVILFLLVKKFLFKPVQKLFADREAAIAHQYAAAEAAKREALSRREEWQAKLDDAHAEADAIVKDATERADANAKRILAEADAHAEQLVTRAREEAELERRRVAHDIKQEIVESATVLAEKMLEREVRTEDHSAMIDAFIDEMGESDDADH